MSIFTANSIVRGTRSAQILLEGLNLTYLQLFGIRDPVSDLLERGTQAHGHCGA